MTKKLPMLLTLAAALTAPMAFAQSSTTTTATTVATTPNPPTIEEMVAARVKFLARLLDLTADQQAQATAIFTTQENALAIVRPAMGAAHDALKTALESGDSAGVAAAAGQIGTLTSQQIVADATAEMAFRGILTARQLTKYNLLRRAGVGGPNGQGKAGGPPPTKP